MKTLNSTGTERSGGIRQKGVVLLIALIALAIISLAAVALIRSVDTSSIIAGNVAFKQSTVSSGEAALIEVSRWIEVKMNNPATMLEMESDNAAMGYYAKETFTSDPKNSILPKLTSTAAWDGSRSAIVNDYNNAPGDTDYSGNTIRYIIERMCTAYGPASTERCLFGPGSDNTDTSGIKNDPNPRPSGTTSSVMFRVTARVLGPKNTVSYIQTFIY